MSDSTMPSVVILNRGGQPESELVASLRAEIARLKEGRFTEEEFQNLCHNFNTDDETRFKRGCEEYQAKLFGVHS